MERRGTCPVCFGEFAGKRRDARFCWNGCRQRAWRRRKALRAALAAAEAARKAADRKRRADFVAALIG
jgi:hypothetical protein